MSLRDWLANGWLAEHRSNPQEIASLLAVADRDLADAKVPGLSTDARFNLAYNAALQSALAALAAAGFRVARGESHHHRAIQSLSLTIGADRGRVALLDKFRKKRNVSGYEQAGTVSETEAGEVLREAHALRSAVEKWLRADHPALLP